MVADLYSGLKRITPRGVKRLVRTICGQGYLYDAKGFLARRRFSFNGKRLRYFVSEYNSTWLNERAVELPIVMDVVKSHGGQRILEVGNVLSHYSSFPHEIVDKFEDGPGVTNEDIVDFEPPHAYDLIVSISTLEHVGWDEATRYAGSREYIGEPNKLPEAVSRMRRWLAPGGMMVVTAPLGYNPLFDEAVVRDRLGLDALFFLKRTSSSNLWVQVDLRDVRGSAYGSPYPCGNAVTIGVAKA